jgi:hypothetical protein
MRSSQGQPMHLLKRAEANVEIRAIAIVGPCFRIVKTNIECHEELEIWGFCSMVGI